jgi:hypothetical protein
MHCPVVNADMSKIAAFCHSSWVKKHGAGLQKTNIIEIWSSVEHISAETLYIDMCITSMICECS